jgi:hypothetical protein
MTPVLATALTTDDNRGERSSTSAPTLDRILNL